VDGAGGQARVAPVTAVALSAHAPVSYGLSIK
jgi:hypothetical protein